MDTNFIFSANTPIRLTETSSLNSDNFNAAPSSIQIVSNSSKELVFIDAAVEVPQHLLTALKPAVKAYILDAKQDGIQQITEIIGNEKLMLENEMLSITKHQLSIHIIAHATSGRLLLGNTELSLDTLNHYVEALKTWFSPSTSLPLSASLQSLHLYACNLAAGDAGKEFIAKLNTITGVTIHASTTKIGNVALGGNWELDTTIQSSKLSPSLLSSLSPFQSSALDTYPSILMVDTDGDLIDDSDEDIDGDGDPTNDDTDNDGIPNYLDTDDDQDGILTQFENPDPNGDGDPSDAQNTDLAANFTSLTFLGDSLTDTGNLFTVTQGLIPPEIADTGEAAYFEGRFSDGPNWADFLAEELELSPATFELTLLDPTISTEEGINFAVGGALSGEATESTSPSTGITATIPGVLEEQLPSLLDNFEIDPTGLYSVWVGSNDYYAFSPVEPVIENISSTIESLIQAGAQNILAFNLQDQSLTPLGRFFFPSDLSQLLQDLTLAHNQQLELALDDLRSEYSDVNIFSVDVASLFDEFRATPAAFGFQDIANACIPPDPTLDLGSSHGCL